MLDIDAGCNPTSAKNSAGIGSSHQSSKSIGLGTSALSRVDRRTRLRRKLLGVIAAKPVKLALKPRAAHDAGQQSRRHAESKCNEQQKDERRLPGEPVIEADGD